MIEPEESREPEPASRPEHDADKEALLIERLRLDNDEQRARIAQLQLKWWQKPIGLLAMILPLVPLMVSGAAAVANQWSEQAKAAAALEQEVAAAQIKEAILEKQGYELENKRLGNEKAKMEFENRLLRHEQQQLKHDEETLAVRVQELREAERQLVNAFFKQYENVCEIGGKIVTAPDHDTAAAEFAKYDAFDVVAIDTKLEGSLMSWIVEVGEQIEQWRSTGQRPTDDLERAVLKVSMACKQALDQRRNDQFRTPFIELTIAIYEEAETIVKQLEDATDFADAEPTVDRFWELYYGKLVLVENQGVENAMVRSGQALKAWREGPPNQVVLEQLSAVFRDEYKALMESLSETATDPGKPLL